MATTAAALLAATTLPAALPAAAQDAAAARGLRNAVTVTVDLARDDAKPASGSNGSATGLLFDLEYARQLFGPFELTFSAGARSARLDDGSGTSAAHTFRYYQVGGRIYFWEPRQSTWTAYGDASIGEGSLDRSGAGGDLSMTLYGYELGLGLAAHLSPRTDLRVGVNYDRYVGRDKVGSERDTLTRLGLRVGVAYRF